MIVFAKGVTSGYLPLGGVVAHERVAAPFWDDPVAPPFRHGATYSGHPAACAAALANLDILEGGGAAEARADAPEVELHDALRSLHDHPLVDSVRGGTGVLGALELDPERVRAEPGLPARVAEAVRGRGALIGDQRRSRRRGPVGSEHALPVRRGRPGPGAGGAR